MTQQKTDNYIKACLKAWLFCESCSAVEMNKPTSRYDLIIECNACAEACFDVVTRLLSKPDDLGDLPFNCMIHCWQCIEECQKYSENETIKACIDSCTACAESIKEIAVFTLN